MLDYRSWEDSVPSAITGDALWNVKAYRLSLYSSYIGWEDVTKLAGDERTRSIASQLYRALGSIGANIAEGYSRCSHKEKARFYEYALGSARESRHWYYKAQHILGQDILQARLDILTNAIRLLLAMVPDQRASVVREDRAEYLPARDIDLE